MSKSSPPSGTPKVVVYVDMGYLPISHWAERWGKGESTVRGWILAGTCPGKKIGGIYMISQLELMNWEPPDEDEKADPKEPKANGKGKGGGLVRDEKSGRVGSSRPTEPVQEASWAV